MQFYSELQDDVVILHLEGNLIGGPEAVRLNEEINQLLDSNHKKLVLDLVKVDRMNSSGLGIMINALSTFKQNGGRLKLVNLSQRVRNLLSTTRLDSIFEIYDSLDAAISSF